METLKSEVDKRFDKSPCRICGEFCYHLCYVGTKLVCVDCFKVECDKRKARGAK